MLLRLSISRATLLALVCMGLLTVSNGSSALPQPAASQRSGEKEESNMDTVFRGVHTLSQFARFHRQQGAVTPSELAYSMLDSAVQAFVDPQYYVHAGKGRNDEKNTKHRFFGAGQMYRDEKRGRREKKKERDVREKMSSMSFFSSSSEGVASVEDVDTARREDLRKQFMAQRERLLSSAPSSSTASDFSALVAEPRHVSFENDTITVSAGTTISIPILCPECVGSFHVETFSFSAGSPRDYQRIEQTILVDGDSTQEDLTLTIPLTPRAVGGVYNFVVILSNPDGFVSLGDPSMLQVNIEPALHCTIGEIVNVSRISHTCSYGEDEAIYLSPVEYEVATSLAPNATVDGIEVTCNDTVPVYFNLSSSTYDNQTEVMAVREMCALHGPVEDGGDGSLTVNETQWCQYLTVCSNQVYCTVKNETKEACYCPYDATGTYCEETPITECSLSLVDPDPNCAEDSSLSSPLFHTYDFRLDGDPPCMTVDPSAPLSLSFSVECKFVRVTEEEEEGEGEGEGTGEVEVEEGGDQDPIMFEGLGDDATREDGYTVIGDVPTFSYAVNVPAAPFALSTSRLGELPYIKLRFWDFNTLSNRDFFSNTKRLLPQELQRVTNHSLVLANFEDIATKTEVGGRLYFDYTFVEDVGFAVQNMQVKSGLFDVLEYHQPPAPPAELADWEIALIVLACVYVSFLTVFALLVFKLLSLLVLVLCWKSWSTCYFAFIPRRLTFASAPLFFFSSLHLIILSSLHRAVVAMCIGGFFFMRWREKKRDKEREEAARLVAETPDQSDRDSF